ncbi:acyl-CoA thioesterase [Ectothiorhodospira variabilis]|uniref:acyl-CoA thioesterase n=1 Tax=Ectothiorhodospira variabilis TaxID=505694 RepID=UPI001EFA7009|nr:acyl-CoA thioesterase [Ectothiorhodospira variabilis]MCG5493663.1 acyl-CoA thioesterase [Ectothiorhodospira variabilis]MCG5502992.1 acyl-CoA thioesterase [Ectothiorhodospira variabilis]MCG5506220.1 acyl-CoA thioesterase [Ectothiorhodospira variabilis]
MDTFKLVRPEHLNHYGYLFGGFLLKWVDEIAWIAASRDYPGGRFVTVAMNSVEFHKGVHQGTVLRFSTHEHQRGRTSVQYAVSAFADDLESGREEPIFSTCVTFVHLDGEGNKTPLPEGTD